MKGLGSEGRGGSAPAYPESRNVALIRLCARGGEQVTATDRKMTPQGPVKEVCNSNLRNRRQSITICSTAQGVIDRDKALQGKSSSVGTSVQVSLDFSLFRWNCLHLVCCSSVPALCACTNWYGECLYHSVFTTLSLSPFESLYF